MAVVTITNFFPLLPTFFASNPNFRKIQLLPTFFAVQFDYIGLLYGILTSYKKSQDVAILPVSEMGL